VISTTRALVTAGLTIGLIAGGAGTAFAATPTATGSTASIVSAESPRPIPPPLAPHKDRPKPPGEHGNGGNWGGKGPDHNWDGNWGGKHNRGDNWGDRNRGDHNRDRDRGHRDHDRDWGVSPERCRDGGGHVNWHRDRCDGGRFDGDRIR
jgi:hypothetical protein